MGAGRVGEVFLDGERDTELCLVLESVGVISRGLAHVAACRRTDVDDLVAAFIVLKVALHAAELFLDDLETLVDKVGGVDCHSVLIVDGFLIIYGDEGGEHICSEARIGGFDSEVEDSGFGVFLTDAEVAEPVAHYVVARVFDHADIGVDPSCHTVLCRSDEQAGVAYLISLVYLRLEGEVLFHARHVGDPDLLLRERGDCKREGCLRFLTEECHLEGCGAVDVDVAQTAVGGVGDVSIEAAYHLLHQPLGAELQDLVGYVHLVDGVGVAVETGGCCLVGGVFDDDLSRGIVDHRV